MLDQTTLDRLCSAVIPTALEAGAAIQTVANEGTDVTEKADGSPLTRADLASHNMIVEALPNLSPVFPILSEEAVEEFTGRDDPPPVYWCVDPLDGTKEFVKGSGDYTVNIALVRDGIPILGVIYIPAQDVLFHATEEGGAWKTCNASTGNTAPERLPCSVRSSQELTAVVSRSHGSPETTAFLERYGITNAIQHGSSLKICAVAEGAADVYPRLGPTCLWDTAAGAAIARAAGCRIVTPADEPLQYVPGACLKHPAFIVYRPERFKLGNV